MHIDRAGLRVLTRDECLTLLASARIGRIAITSRALPLILPVHFALDDDRIVISTHLGTALETATRDTVVAFEADGASGDSGVWSVHVNGIARHVTDQQTLARLAGLQLRSWSEDRPMQFVSISTDHLSGRQSVDDTAPAAAGARSAG